MLNKLIVKLKKHKTKKQLFEIHYKLKFYEKEGANLQTGNKLD